MNNDNIGKNITKLRKEKNISQSELAKKLNITTTKITWFLEKNNKFIYNNKTYILLKNF